jgi:ribosome-associated protein
VLVSAGNERQLGTVAEEVEGQLKDRLGRSPRRREGQPDTGWMVLDYGDIVVHAFTREQRDYYDLERLWRDAPSLPVPDAGEPAAVGGTAAGMSGAGSQAD